MILIKNSRAKFDYEIKKIYLAGIQLEGREVKSLRLKHASLKNSFVKIIGNEAFLIGAQINPYAYARNEEYDPKKTRKLLLKKSELLELQTAINNKGWVIVPLSLKLAGRNIKLELGLGRGKKQFEKRAKIKERDLKRELARKQY